MALNIFHYLNQGEWWYPNGLPRVLIASEMNNGWRVNAANFLVKRAALYEFHYTTAEIVWLNSGFGGVLREVVEDENGEPMVLDGLVSMMPSGEMACDAFDTMMDYRAENPEEWIKTTTLYKALIGDGSDG